MCPLSLIGVSSGTITCWSWLSSGQSARFSARVLPARFNTAHQLDVSRACTVCLWSQPQACLASDARCRLRQQLRGARFHTGYLIRGGVRSGHCPIVPVTVRQLPSMKPLLSSSFSTAGTPPTCARRQQHRTSLSEGADQTLSPMPSSQAVRSLTHRCADRLMYIHGEECKGSGWGLRVRVEIRVRGSARAIMGASRTLCRSSMTNLPLGFRSAMKGTRSLTACAEEALELGFGQG